MSDGREQAWAAVHDPATDAAALAAIARRHPEFAEAIARHPNCYPELAAWAGAVTAGRGGPAPAGRGVPKAAWWIAGAGSLAVILAGGVWAFAALGGAPGEPGNRADDAPASASAPAGERTLAGPPVYVGDELAWLMLDDDGIRALFTGVGEIERDAVFGGIGEREGAMTDPAVCDAWAFDAQWALVGVRSAGWTGGRATTFQFPTGAEAEEYFASYADTAASCAQYTSGMFGSDPAATPYSSTTVEVVDQDDVSLTARVAETGDYGGESFVALRLEGNVVLSVHADVTSLADASGAAVADALAQAATTARERLTEEIGYR